MNRCGSGYRWLVLLVLVLGSAMLNFSNLVFASHPTEVMARFDMSQAQLTAISSIGLLPGAFFSILLGNFFDGHDGRYIRFVGGLLLLLGAACQFWRVFADGYIQLLIITFLAGAFFLPTQVLPAKMLSAWFPNRQMGVAMGVFGAAAGMGIMSAFALSSLFPDITSALAWTAVAYLVVAVCWLLFARMPEESGPAAGVTSCPATTAGDVTMPAAEIRAVLRSRNMWLVMICGGFAAGVPLLLNSYMVNAFVSRGLTAVGANMLGTVFNISLVVGGIVSGIVVSKHGRYNPTYAVMCFGGGSLLLASFLVPSGALTYVCIALGGLFSAGSVGVNMARISALPLTGDFGPENIGIAGGMNNTAMGVCMFVLPTIVAACVGDDYLAVFIVLLIFFVVIGVVGGFVIPELGDAGGLAKAARGKRP